jgi:hypothetical protein
VAGVKLDPLPLFTTNDRDYAILFTLVTHAAVEAFNKANGG